LDLIDGTGIQPGDDEIDEGYYVGRLNFTSHAIGCMAFIGS
jgi:hypothetical protein